MVVWGLGGGGGLQSNVMGKGTDSGAGFLTYNVALPPPSYVNKSELPDFSRTQFTHV